MKKAFLSALLLVVAWSFVAKAETREELLAQFAMAEEAHGVVQNSPKPDVGNPKAFVEGVMKLFDSSRTFEREKDRISLALLKDLSKTGTDAQIEELLTKSTYQGKKLSDIRKLYQDSLEADHFEISMDLLRRNQQIRTFLALANESAHFWKIGRAFVRQGFTNESFEKFYAEWNVLSEDTKTWKMNERYDFSIHGIVNGMLQESAADMDLQKRVISVLTRNFGKISIKAKKAIVFALGNAKAPGAYQFIRSLFKSSNSELRIVALGTWYMHREIQATEDMIRFVKDLDAGKITLPKEGEVLYNEFSSPINNKISRDLDFPSNPYQRPTAEDFLAREKVRQLVFEMLDSKIPYIKTNFQTYLKSSAFTDREVDVRLMQIATDPVLSNRWSASYIVGNRKMTSAVAMEAMKLLVNDPDEDTAQKARFALNSMESWKLLPRICQVMF